MLLTGRHCTSVHQFKMARSSLDGAAFIPPLNPYHYCIGPKVAVKVRGVTGGGQAAADCQEQGFESSCQVDAYYACLYMYVYIQ